MSGTSAGAVDLDKVDDTQQFPLGLEHHVSPVMAGIAAADLNRGEQVWVYIESAAALVAGSVCGRADGTTTLENITLCPASASPMEVVGVAQHAIASGKFGWILKRGLGEVEADSNGITANTALVPGAQAGHAGDVAAATDFAFGYATEAAAVGVLATCWINCPG